ncbi:hypothetical protein [Clostridium sp.]|uniref:hypothetical protein n=1 Tax=Clostridium sp. TaxID=1506 RepID=UPI003F4AF998
MVRKATLKKINDIIQWIVSISLIGMGICYFFISKDMFKEMNWLIMGGGICIMNAGSIIDSKYSENNLSWKHNFKNFIYVFISTMIVIFEIKRLWF